MGSRGPFLRTAARRRPRWAARAKMGGVLPFAIPLRTRFRGIDVREGLLLHGPAGWGEFSPFWDYDARESAPWLRAVPRLRALLAPRPVTCTRWVVAAANVGRATTTPQPL